MTPFFLTLRHALDTISLSLVDLDRTNATGVPAAVSLLCSRTLHTAIYRSSSVYAQRAAHSNRQYTHVSRRAARANHPSTSVSSTIPD